MVYKSNGAVLASCIFPYPWIFHFVYVLLANKATQTNALIFDAQLYTINTVVTDNCIQEMSRVMRKPTSWFSTWSDTNRAAQPQKMASDLKFGIKKEEGLHYSCSENKGADQLCGYREADLSFCFRLYKMLVFS